MSQAPDAEPFYVLQASNPFAAHTVMMLACFHNGDLAGALASFNDLAQSEAAEAAEAEPDADMAAQLVTLGEIMEGWGQ